MKKTFLTDWNCFTIPKTNSKRILFVFFLSLGYWKCILAFFFPIKGHLRYTSEQWLEETDQWLFLISMRAFTGAVNRVSLLLLIHSSVLRNTHSNLYLPDSIPHIPTSHGLSRPRSPQIRSSCSPDHLHNFNPRNFHVFFYHWSQIWPLARLY